MLIIFETIYNTGLLHFIVVLHIQAPIPTQLPLSNTLSNFWQLIIEQDVKVIVQLEHAEVRYCL